MYKNKKKKRNYKYIKEKSKFSKKADELKKFLTHKLYFMFVPHSKNKTKTLSLPVYSIIIFVIIISGALFITFSFLTKKKFLLEYYLVQS